MWYLCTTDPTWQARWILLAAVVFLTSTCFAQKRDTREIRGTVEDLSHAAISGASVVLKQGGTRRTTTTNEQGTFAFSSASDQPAEMIITATGFAEAHRSLDPGTSDTV